MTVLKLADQREVAVDMVVSEHVAARAREGKMAAVERENVHSVDYDSAHCGTRRKYLNEIILW